MDQTALKNIPAHVPLVKEPWGILRTLQAARRNVLEILPEIATRQPIVSGKTGKRWHMVMDPDTLRHILKDRLEDYPKSDVTKNILRPAIGESLFVAEGTHWRWQRRTAAPVFSHRNIQNLAPMMTTAAERCAERTEKSIGRGVDFYEEMVRATFEVISDVTFSGDEGFDRSAMHNAINSYIDQTAKISLLDILGAPNWVPRPSRILSSGSMKQMKSVADEVIDRRREAATKETPDLLDLLLEGEDPETERKMTTAELRDNLLTFIVAGHETTALTLAWALYLCAFDPEVQNRARTEAQAVLGNRAATAEDCANLPYIRQIVDETLRLYPPAAMLSRTAQKPDTLCGREVRAKDTVILPIYALHRNHLLWDKPNTFNPDRFADPRAINRYAYLPFGDGPRVCIGASFALQEAVIILATLLAKFRFSTIPGKTPKPVMILTLRPEGGVWLKVEKA
ncbi:cytochrome P450 [Pseudohalocynthiibacter aestuariivivens]|jgi:cytochrome P450|uniref:Cytochrome P450 n=1 Tax=Pseudohalocynthiibacter aestuariivivens TaxID=1591409 RepID=A0ABV5JJB0_9RHOB|nr:MULTISPECIES: cytochrome P450 [Pseudohalocynthiibacter]MBS9715495.1 cytochrome P450 [Pseudohalocynthiibacter aestuariivivens]MCK0102559.1 cytochrome P450 [Pseudohalocynthiibacter sp. F2068]